MHRHTSAPLPQCTSSIGAPDRETTRGSGNFRGLVHPYQGDLESFALITDDEAGHWFFMSERALHCDQELQSCPWVVLSSMSTEWLG